MVSGGYRQIWAINFTYCHDHRCEQGEAKANLCPYGLELSWSLPAESLDAGLHAFLSLDPYYVMTERHLTVLPENEYSVRILERVKFKRLGGVLEWMQHYRTYVCQGKITSVVLPQDSQVV